MNINAVARVAALIGEPARTAMLLRLMDGRAMTASELAHVAAISPATASRHLALMVTAGLLQVNAVGRHRYHRIGSPHVGRLMENIMGVAGSPASSPKASPTGPKEAALRQARTCYDHLAGRLGVAIAAKLADDGAVVFDSEWGWITEQAADSLGRLGLADPDWLGKAGNARRALCRPCMDWSERRIHVAGRLGAAICAGCIGHGWLRRRPDSRALDITPRGHLALGKWMGSALWETVVG